MEAISDPLLDEVSARYPEDSDVLLLVSELRSLQFRVTSLTYRLKDKANAEAARAAAELRADREVTRRIMMHSAICEALGEYYVPPADPIESLREVAKQLRPLAKCQPDSTEDAP